MVLAGAWSESSWCEMRLVMVAVAPGAATSASISEKATMAEAEATGELPMISILMTTVRVGAAVETWVEMYILNTSSSCSCVLGIAKSTQDPRIPSL